jgi:hypothetical protein
VAERAAFALPPVGRERSMTNLRYTTPADRRAIYAAELLAATFAKNPKLRGMTIVVTDEHDNTICKVAVPSQH